MPLIGTLDPVTVHSGFGGYAFVWVALGLLAAIAAGVHFLSAPRNSEHGVTRGSSSRRVGTAH